MSCMNIMNIQQRLVRLRLVMKGAHLSAPGCHTIHAIHPPPASRGARQGNPKPAAMSSHGLLTTAKPWQLNIHEPSVACKCLATERKDGGLMRFGHDKKIPKSPCFWRELIRVALILRYSRPPIVHHLCALFLGHLKPNCGEMTRNDV